VNALITCLAGLPTDDVMAAHRVVTGSILRKKTALVFPPLSLASTRFSLLLPSNTMPKSTFPFAKSLVPISVECGLAHQVLVAVEKPNPAASRSIRSRVIDLDVLFEADRLHAAPAVAIDGNASHHDMVN
jgi:hypothetical protein